MCFIWNIALYGAETWTLRIVDQNYLESFEMWCWRRMEKTNWTNRVRNEEVLYRLKGERNILHLQSKEERLTELEMTRRRGRRRKQLLDDLKGGYSYLNVLSVNSRLISQSTFCVLSHRHVNA
jgi:hypothetical protein